MPKICFLHVNSLHRVLEHPRQGIHHLLVELYSLDDVGQDHDVAWAQADRVKVPLGRHNNDYMTSFNMQTPSSGCSFGKEVAMSNGAKTHSVDFRGQRVEIPKDRVLTGPNPTGHAVWWYTESASGRHD
jgi:hypothetical protein